LSYLLIIAAAGTGSRLGRREPKALVPLLGRPLISWTLDAFAAIPFEGAVIAAPPGRERDFEALVGSRARIVAGGDTRAASVRRAFDGLSAGPRDLVCIHDAARPLVAAAEVLSVLEAAGVSGAAIAATRIVDTVKQVENERIVATLDRRCLFAAATPQVFRADLLARALASGSDVTDEATLLERMGVAVSPVTVSRLGFKVTTPEDLELAEAILRGRNTEDGTRKTEDGTRNAQRS
jgi:2-C-methyl-D-erythritol 4-phosphate cytidylyltransferase